MIEDQARGDVDPASVAIDRLPSGDDVFLPMAYEARAAANCALGKKAAALEDETNFGMLVDAARLKTRCR